MPISPVAAAPGTAIAAECDVFVIGGGPAGSTAATLLASAGWRVTLCDKDVHPRFHVGESLLPMNMPLFRRLGVLDGVREIGVDKFGADFSSPSHPNGTRAVRFADALDAREASAFQVRRDQFDHLLLRNARAHGVAVHEGASVASVETDSRGDSRVLVTTEAGEQTSTRTHFVIDASGRDTLLARQLGTKLHDPYHRSAAMFAHYRGVRRRTGEASGNISIYWLKHGWAWMIPLPDGLMSVGVVGTPEQFRQRGGDGDRERFVGTALAEHAEASQRMAAAELDGEVHSAGNYSYRATRMRGKGYALVGDAFAFVDPIFSSGVFLAMNSAALAADAIDAELRGAPDAARLMRRFESHTLRGARSFSWFIYRFATPVLHDLFMAPRNLLGARAAVTSIFAGDVHRPRVTTLPLAIFKGVYYIASALRART